MVKKNVIVCILIYFIHFNRFNIFFNYILQYVVIPTRRSTAEAFQILIAHAFGDAGSPYLIGLVRKSKNVQFIFLTNTINN